MSAAVAAAVGAWTASLVAPPVPVSLVVGSVAVALAHRRRWTSVLAVCLCAAALAARADAGMVPVEREALDGWVTLTSDPERYDGAVRARVVDARGRHLDAWARGAAAGVLDERLAGESVPVRGRTAPLEGAPWLEVRHVVGRLSVSEVGPARRSPAPAAALNALRSLLARGASVLDDDQRALFGGFVLGDGRELPADVEDDFRAAGLTHLLVVSGQNVAFVLTLAGPLLRMMPLRWRWVPSAAVVAGFVALTRFEPSVLRAGAMAAVAAVASSAGRRADGVAILALGVCAAVLADPFLPRSLGFQLSVAASLGLLVAGAPLARRLPGPRWVAELVGTTVAAQLAVAPLLATVGEGLAPVSVVANLLAGVAAAPLVVWGLLGGALAGAVPAAAEVLHRPTSLLVGWVAGVARVAAAVPLAPMGPAAVGLAVGAAAVALSGQVGSGARRVAWVLVLVALVGPTVSTARRAPPLEAAVARDATAWRAGGSTVLVLGSGIDDAALLGGLRRARVDAIAVLVCAGGPRTCARTTRVLEGRHRVDVVWVPTGAAVPGGVVPARGRHRVGGLEVVVEEVSPRLSVARITG